MCYCVCHFFTRSAHTTLHLAVSRLSDLILLGGGAAMTQCSCVLTDCSPLLFQRSSIPNKHVYMCSETSCIVTGSYFCYDNPAALQDQMLKDLNLTEGKFMLFYSLYSWPNVVLCFFGGFLIDKLFGVRLGAIIFSGFVLVGQVCTGTKYELKL